MPNMQPHNAKYAPAQCQLYIVVKYDIINDIVTSACNSTLPIVQYQITSLVIILCSYNDPLMITADLSSLLFNKLMFMLFFLYDNLTIIC